MRRIVVLASLSLLALTAVPADAGVVSVLDNDFAPLDHVLTAPGRLVTWEWDENVKNMHSIRQREGLFSSGPETNDPAATFERRFSAGSFDYYCGVHGVSMSGRVRVPVTIATAPTGRPFTVRWATLSTNVGQVFDVQYRIGSGAWLTWRMDTSKPSRVFGKDGKPVVVKAGRTYSFRARTQRIVGEPLDRSGWSLVRSFQA
jgi:plastocyanin